ncbi:septum formation initiator family protein [Streptococcus minor]|uniref:Septum formation initiator family protein n=1 Tax=Streptococcus minor TaxID=229549 RepID=A0A3P1VAI7_9STRE|nr:septum formation initiator family protein [Streptococcus minor]MDO5079499.1 septum formation initiator family protein [Streptococcus minor]RRD29593.1 septum formation initiator family protein [Streptococcus minor]
MKKSNILQINNDFIKNELQKRKKNDVENRQKTRFMGLILVLAIFLFILPTYNLVESYNTLKDKEKQLVQLKERQQELIRQEKLESSLVTKLKDEEYAAKYIRAKLQYSKDGEFIYNIPGLLPK